jgi:hypothetical protein
MVHSQADCVFILITSHQNHLLLLMKRSIEHTFASADPETLHNHTEYTKGVDACL